MNSASLKFKEKEAQKEAAKAEMQEGPGTVASEETEAKTNQKMPETIEQK